MSRDLVHPRKFTGGIDNTILQLNALWLADWPLFLSEEGDPKADALSETPPYIVGVMLNRPACIEHVTQWAKALKFEMVGASSTPPTGKSVVTMKPTNPPNDVSIQNWTRHRVMQLGEAELPLTEAEATRLSEILGKEYVVVVFEDYEQRCEHLWPELLRMFQSMTTPWAVRDHRVGGRAPDGSLLHPGATKKKTARGADALCPASTPPAP